MKSARIWSFSSPYFPHLDTFHAVLEMIETNGNIKINCVKAFLLVNNDDYFFQPVIVTDEVHLPEHVAVTMVNVHVWEIMVVDNAINVVSVTLISRHVEVATVYLLALC